MQTHPFDSVEPVELTWQEQGGQKVMAVTWSDGLVATYTPGLLRRICPCAECKGTHTGKPKAFNILTASQAQGIHRETVIAGVEPVGNYAVAFTWGDGHREGIYSWSYLRANAPKGAKPATSGDNAPQPEDPTDGAG